MNSALHSSCVKEDLDNEDGGGGRIGGVLLSLRKLQNCVRAGDGLYVLLAWSYAGGVGKGRGVARVVAMMITMMRMGKSGGFRACSEKNNFDDICVCILIFARLHGLSLYTKKN